MLYKNYNNIKKMLFLLKKNSLPSKLAISWNLLWTRVEEEGDLERARRSLSGFCAKAQDRWIHQI